MTRTFIDWFAGVGGFSLALSRSDYRCVGACEIDPFARRVYSARLGAPAWFPEDICDVEANSIPEADLWCGGFPCQNLSVAGRRAGIHGAQSGLVWRLLDLARERGPAYILLENVPGLLSGADGDLDGEDVGESAGRSVSWLGALLGGLAESGYVDGAWRALDARWFVPQRRARLFILARRAGAGGRHPAEVLLEREGVRRDPPARREAREDIAGCLEARAGRGGYGTSADEAAGRHLIPTITASAGHHGRSSPRGDGADALIAFDRTQLTRPESRAACPRCGGSAAGVTYDEAHGGMPAGFNAKAESGSGGNGYEVGISPPVRGSNPPATTEGVRRLTPTECERLQGFPDGWTCVCGCAPYSTRACRCPDGPRYRALGNAVCVDVVEWIVIAAFASTKLAENAVVPA